MAKVRVGAQITYDAIIALQYFSVLHILDYALKQHEANQHLFLLDVFLPPLLVPQGITK